MTRVVFVGELYNAGLEVGGGPILPGAPSPPLGIWGPTDPRPSNPIVIPPDAIGPGLPEFPVVLPPVINGGPGSLPGLPPTISGGPGSLPPSIMLPIVIPPAAIVPAPDGSFHAVVYVQTAKGLERVTFSGQLPPPTVPEYPEPKPVG